MNTSSIWRKIHLGWTIYEFRSKLAWNFTDFHSKYNVLSSVSFEKCWIGAYKGGVLRIKNVVKCQKESKLYPSYVITVM